MRHPSSRALFAIWDTHRGTERAPCRSDLPPEAMRQMLGDIFVVSFDTHGEALLRMAGTRVCAMLGQNPTGMAITTLFNAASRRDLAEIICDVANESLVAVAGATGRGASGRSVPIELSLLPFRSRSHSPSSLIGLILPMGAIDHPVSDLTLTSWRYLGHPAERAAPRALRKVALAEGLVVYEGQR